MKTIKLQPANYSNAKTITDVVNCIQHYPQQGVNNPSAFKYSVEFVEVDGSSTRPGTLLEYNHEGNYERFILQLADGEMTVYKNIDQFYFEALSIKSDYIKFLETAFIDIMDGQDLGDIQDMTGLSINRCNEILAVYKMACHQKNQK